MSRTVKNVTKQFIEIQYEFTSLPAILELPFLIYLFSIQIHNRHLQKPIIMFRIPVMAKITTKV